MYIAVSMIKYVAICFILLGNPEIVVKFKIT